MNCSVRLLVSTLALFVTLMRWGSPPLVWGDDTVHRDDLAKKELTAIQGTWHLVAHERDGKEAPFKDIKTAWLIIENDKVTYKQGGETLVEGKVGLDATKNPKHLDLAYTSGRSDLTIYVRVGDYIIQCGNVDEKTRPSEFTSGTEKGGTYLNVWNREK